VFRRVLVANRGEIAVRVIRACRDLGVESVAVYSDVDRTAPHVLLADEAYPIGQAPAAASYLRGDTLIEVARRAGCDAIHPGYGFLAERADFAAAVEAAGLVFIGPPATAIAAMGEKTEARRRMGEAGVPIVPGTLNPVPGVDEAKEAAAGIGYPIMLKAAAGGGGKGMRVVHGESDLAAAFGLASAEAAAAFGDGAIFIEKFLDSPRHIEIQVLADSHGNVVHLGERECSIQRRHQKLIEEAPSPAVSPELRARMGAAAVAACRAVGYRNAGTIEFLVQGGSFYFLEMNTRIQVEHPVTELVTGVDIVQWQIRIAAGEALDFGQDDVYWNGHAIECRITSEDADRGFLPATGRINHITIPAGLGVRWDGAIANATEVSPYYDPLLGKLIVHGADRASAILRMSRALAELEVVGVETTVDFHRRVMNEPEFQAGQLDIRYLERHPELFAPAAPEEVLRAVALAAALLEEERREHSLRRAESRASNVPSAWRQQAWR